jgi:hypothetical protein
MSSSLLSRRYGKVRVCNTETVKSKEKKEEDVFDEIRKDLQHLQLIVKDGYLAFLASIIFFLCLSVNFLF